MAEKFGIEIKNENSSRCAECGYRVRGPHHVEGDHHKKKHPKLRKELK